MTSFRNKLAARVDTITLLQIKTLLMTGNILGAKSLMEEMHDKSAAQDLLEEFSSTHTAPLCDEQVC